MPQGGSGTRKRAPEILVIAAFSGDDVSSNNRFNDMARRLSARGAQVELMTSTFSHAQKIRRAHTFDTDKYTLTHIEEPGYERNVSVKRIWSQHRFAKNVLSALRRRTSPPNLIYCATPPPSVARAAAIYAKESGAKLVVDIQDLWPEAFAMVSPLPRLTSAGFISMRRASQLAYESSALVVGVSQTYVDSAVLLARKPLRTRVVYLGSGLAAFPESSLKERSSSRQTVRIAYVGTLSISYDLPLVISAMARFTSDHRAAMELVVFGDGPLRVQFEKLADQEGVHATFRGKLPYHEMALELSGCHIAVNPIVEGSAGSILNKVADYAAAGLAVLNTQESPEYRDLLKTYGAGLSTSPASVDDLTSALSFLVDHPNERAAMGLNNRKMAEAIFDREKTYEEFASDLLQLALEE